MHVKHRRALVAAVNLRYERGRVPASHLKAPTELPAPGQPPNLATYRRILEGHDALAAEGFRAPLKELATRWEVPYERMKTWYRRARQYLEEEGRTR